MNRKAITGPAHPSILSSAVERMDSSGSLNAGTWVERWLS